MGKVTVFITKSKDAHVFEGENYTVQPLPEGILAVYEMVPDVGMVNEGKDIGRLRVLYNNHDWQRVMVGDKDE